MIRPWVLFGNSAGGQFVNRYAAVDRGPDVLAGRGLQVRFVISNPSTYLYFDRERPVSVPDGARVNHWRYGLAQDSYSYGEPQSSAVASIGFPT